MQNLNEEYDPAVAVAELELHPDNPRLGDVDLIAESIETNGFYGSLVVQRSTRRVLAGNHRLKAALKIGEETVPVTWVDVDDEAARRILLVDNRANDAASYDDEALSDLLAELGDKDGGLVGTGWTDVDLDDLLGELEPDEDPDAPFELADLEPPTPSEREQRFIVADVFAGLSTLPDNSVDLVMSSPPFLALRSYLPAEREEKALEIGSEATPADFLDTMLDVVEACGRVLAPHGSLVFEIGDTYSGSSMGGGDLIPGSGSIQQPKKLAVGQLDPSKATKREGQGWPLDKSLCGIPTLFAWSLAYGRNLLRPERQTAPWRIRNLVAWVRPNPPVGALGDKWRPATSYLTVATKARDRWFDLDAVRKLEDTNGGAPPLDWWKITTQPYSGSHYAAYPEELCRIPIESMCPRAVCTECGEPRRRIVDTSYVDANGNPAPKGEWASGVGEGKGAHSLKTETRTATTTTLGWTDCGCGAEWRPGVVLDPFAGSGTTLAVADELERAGIGIDLDARNARLARERVGDHLAVDDRRTDAERADAPESPKSPERSEGAVDVPVDEETTEEIGSDI